MNMATVSLGLRARGVRLAACLAVGLALGGCAMLPTFLGGTPPPAKPAELPPNPNLLGVRQAWTVRLGPVQMPLSVQVTGSDVVVASSDGQVALLDAASGAQRWRASVEAPLSAGVGSDGRTAAVITRTHELVALNGGQILWREKLAAQSHTAPLVAGGRVFVLAGDRSVSAHDGATGRKLWTQQRPSEPLVLRQNGVLLAVGDTLVVGQGGRLAGLNPANGSIRWEAPIGVTRGTNDVERLIDLVGPVSRVGTSVCARAFQAAVGCVDTARGTADFWHRIQRHRGRLAPQRRRARLEHRSFRAARPLCPAVCRTFTDHRRQLRLRARVVPRRRQPAHPPDHRWLGHRRSARARGQRRRGGDPHRWRFRLRAAVSRPRR
jgi:hypothetical protein